MERKTVDKSSAEIDLFQLFTSAVDIITRIFSLLWKNLLIFLGIFLLVGVLGYCIRYVLPRYYVTKAIFVSRLLPANYSAYQINGVNEQVKSADVSAISSELH